jgi:hypothetical protein
VLTPMPGVTLDKRSPLKELVPIETFAGPSHETGKSREEHEMDEGAVEKAKSPSVTVFEYEGAFHNEDSAFMHD